MHWLSYVQLTGNHTEIS